MLHPDPRKTAKRKLQAASPIDANRIRILVAPIVPLAQKLSNIALVSCEKKSSCQDREMLVAVQLPSDFGVANFVKIQEADFEPRFLWCSLTVDGVQAPIDRFSIVHVVIAEQIKAMLTYACGSLDKRVHLIRHSVPNHVDAFTDL